MNNYLLRKIGWALFTVAFVVVLNFFLFRILPGDPARAVRDPRLTQQAIEAIRVRFGLDQPLHVQFLLYIRNLLQGELGTSFHSQRPVAQILLENLWNTLLLIGAGTFFSIILGIALGILAAWRSRTAVDYSILVASLVGFTRLDHVTLWIFGATVTCLDSSIAITSITKCWW